MIRQSYCLKIAVKNLDSAIRIYEAMLGHEATAMAAGPTSGSRGVEFPIGGPYSLGLVAPRGVPDAKSDDVVARHLALRGEGAFLVGFTVDDVDACSRRLQGEGIRLLSREPEKIAGGRSVFTDPEQTAGTVLQFTQFDDPAAEERRWSERAKAAVGRRAYQAYVLDIAVRDLAKSQQIFAKALGIEAIPMPDGADPSDSMDACHFTVGGPSPSGVGGLYAVGLMTPRGEPKGPIPQAVHDYLDAHGDGSFLIAFLTQDLDRQIQHLRSLAIDLCYDEPMRYVHGRLQMTVPVHGVWLDFAQHDADAFERWQSGH